MRIFLFLFSALFFFSCSENKESDRSENTAVVDSTSVNPNGDSELAILMRKMVVFTQNTKDSIEKKKNLPPYPKEFDRIFFAKKTDRSIDASIFNAHAQNYLKHVENLYSTKTNDTISKFNAMITSCVSCHENFCGGPIKRIKKFYISDKQ